MPRRVTLLAAALFAPAAFTRVATVRNARPSLSPYRRTTSRFAIVSSLVSLGLALSLTAAARACIPSGTWSSLATAGGLGEPGYFCYSLVHRPTRRIIATLPYRKSCKALAAELASVL